MCNRYSLVAAAERLQHRFEVELLDQIALPAMIRISDQAPIMTTDGFRMAAFGLLVAGKRIFNARSETWEERDLFKDLQPCLIPASSFWESSIEFRPSAEDLLVFPGVLRAGEFAVMTMEPDAVVSPHHDRMPVCLKKEQQASWMDSRHLELHYLARLKAIINQPSLDFS